MNQKQAKKNRRMIRKAQNRIYDLAFEGFMRDYNELSLWQKIKLAFQTEKRKKQNKRGK